MYCSTAAATAAEAAIQFASFLWAPYTHSVHIHRLEDEGGEEVMSSYCCSSLSWCCMLLQPRSFPVKILYIFIFYIKVYDINGIAEIAMNLENGIGRDLGIMFLNKLQKTYEGTFFFFS